MLKKKWKIIIPAVLIPVLLFIVFRNGENGDFEYKTAKVERGDIESIIATTGTINPVNTVEVGSQVSGNILKIYVDFNSQVKKGQLLAQIDPSTYQTRVNEAKAYWLKAKVSLEQAKRNLERGKKLFAEKFISESDLEDLEFNVKSAEASLEQLQAAYETAKENLKNCDIYSPIDGVVITRDVDTGQTVAATYQAPTLFTIAEDLSKMQIETDVDEADIGRIKEGQNVRFDVDAYVDKKFDGVVSQIRLEPAIESNVVTYTVIVTIENPDLLLKPGMTANVSILEKVRKNVLRVSADVNRFVMPAVISQQYVQSDSSDKQEEAGKNSETGETPPPPQNTESNQGSNSSQRPKPSPEQIAKFKAMTPEARRAFFEKMRKQKKSEGYEEKVVWLKKADGTLEPKAVILGLSDGDMTEIARSDLKEGDELVISVLKDGQVVKQAQGEKELSFRDVRRTTRGILPGPPR
ncbi:MAG: efflux RND transporter periplasmic adaptor subunit [Acidobacteria bacterium]|nr:efflux RND transporter periplasmic adaptor subunit [Acidobacteriota bacterium]